MSEAGLSGSRLGCIPVPLGLRLLVLGLVLGLVLSLLRLGLVKLLLFHCCLLGVCGAAAKCAVWNERVGRGGFPRGVRVSARAMSYVVTKEGVWARGQNRRVHMHGATHRHVSGKWNAEGVAGST